MLRKEKKSYGCEPCLISCSSSMEFCQHLKIEKESGITGVQRGTDPHPAFRRVPRSLPRCEATLKQVTDRYGDQDQLWPNCIRKSGRVADPHPLGSPSPALIAASEPAMHSSAPRLSSKVLRQVKRTQQTPQSGLIMNAASTSTS